MMVMNKLLKNKKLNVFILGFNYNTHSIVCNCKVSQLEKQGQVSYTWFLGFNHFHMLVYLFYSQSCNKIKRQVLL